MIRAFLMGGVTKFLFVSACFPAPTNNLPAQNFLELFVQLMASKLFSQQNPQPKPGSDCKVPHASFKLVVKVPAVPKPAVRCPKTP